MLNGPIDARSNVDEEKEKVKRFEPPYDLKEEKAKGNKNAILIVALTIIFFVLFFLTGCSSVTPEPVVITKVEKVEVKVPVKPKIPKITCEFEGVGMTPTKKLLECVIFQKHILDFLTTDYDPAGDVLKQMQDYLSKQNKKYKNLTLE
jgi:hypothetical protein|nr:MAG TPA: protein of unknown function (DUF4969) [Caudoviricetes sp.]